MIGAGTFISPLLKVVTTVAILAGVYFFIVGPILDTTEEQIERAGREFGSSQRESEQRSRDLDLRNARSRALSYAQGLRAGSQPWNAASREVVACVRRAGSSVAQMERCNRFASLLVTEAQSDRGFATSYADSLDLQGRAGDADRVRECVEDAGFNAVRMQRCRDLADRLLFG